MRKKEIDSDADFQLEDQININSNRINDNRSLEDLETFDEFERYFSFNRFEDENGDPIALEF